VVRDLEPRWRAYLGPDHQLVLALADAACPVLVDQERIEQILVNLLDNAAKYSPRGGEVTLLVERVEDGVVLRVRDRGIGLTPGSRELMFEPFARDADAEHLNVAGLGIGLPSVRLI